MIIEPLSKLKCCVCLRKSINSSNHLSDTTEDTHLSMFILLCSNISVLSLCDSISPAMLPSSIHYSILSIFRLKPSLFEVRDRTRRGWVWKEIWAYTTNEMCCLGNDILSVVFLLRYFGFHGKTKVLTTVLNKWTLTQTYRAAPNYILQSWYSRP